MKAYLPFVALLLLIPEISLAQYKFGSERAPERPWRKTVDGLGLCLSVTTTPGKDLIEAFGRPLSNSPLVVEEANRVKRNESFTIFLLFQNCSPDATGRCNLSATYRVLAPDKKLVMEQVDLPVWRMPPPPLDKIELGKAVWANIAFDVEPVGKYPIKAVIKDYVRGTTVILERSLELVEPE